MRNVSTTQLVAFLSAPQFGGDPNRPHSGQPWTFCGERGRTKVPPHMSLRDVGDVIRERYDALRALGEIDPDALVQSVLCELEQEGKS